MGNDAAFYGTTAGGLGGNGTVFQLTTNGTLTTLAVFPGGYDGSLPAAALTQGNDGNFYGTTENGGIAGWGTMFRVMTNGNLTTLVSFGRDNGSEPLASLTLGNDGNFYGSTYVGSTYNAGEGTIFKVTTNGILTTLDSFTGDEHGYFAIANPKAELILGNDGNFYGTSYGGGPSNLGTIFQVTTNGALTILISFVGTNGANPQASLALGSDGNFYGTTSGGGGSGQGTIFQLTTKGVLTTLVSFVGTNGANPLGGLTPGSDGNLYGTTSAGGIGGMGTVFRVTTNGMLTTLVSFTGGKGRYPEAAMTLGRDGNFYGTAYKGGVSDQGAIFQITTSNTFVTLASFAGTNGANPAAGLTQGNDGNFYGTTYAGGSKGYGTVFAMTTNGLLTTLVSFTNGNGANPHATLVLGNDGNFYGTTYGGGDSGVGVVFRFGFPPIPPFITSQPTSVAVTNGGSANFYVAASGPMPFSYQWFTSSGHTATAVPYMIGNQVQSVIMTSGGADYSSVPKVQFIGSSLSKASGTAVISDGMVTAINVISHGIYFVPPTIQIDNPSSTINQTLSGRTNATLTLPAVTSDDATNYFVVVTNIYGSVTSAMVGLAVFLPPQVFSAQNLGTGLQLQFTGTPHYPYALQSTTNLTPPVIWKSMLTNSADANGDWQFTDTNLDDAQRFYRAVGQ